MYCSTDNNNDVEMLSESRKLLLLNISTPSHLPAVLIRGEICPSRQSRRECKIFASGVNFFQKQRNLQ